MLEIHYHSEIISTHVLRNRFQSNRNNTDRREEIQTDHGIASPWKSATQAIGSGPDSFSVRQPTPQRVLHFGFPPSFFFLLFPFPCHYFLPSSFFVLFFLFVFSTRVQKYQYFPGCSYELHHPSRPGDTRPVGRRFENGASQSFQSTSSKVNLRNLSRNTKRNFPRCGRGRTLRKDFCLRGTSTSRLVF